MADNEIEEDVLEVAAEQAKASDTIEVPDDETIVFSDNPDGTPADLPEAEADDDGEEEDVDEELEGDEEEAKADDGEEAEAESDEKPQKRRRRNRKDFDKRIAELTKKTHQSDERAAAAQAKLELAEKELAEFRAGRKPMTVEEMDATEKELLEKKKAAFDEGDLELYDSVQTQLSEIKQRRESVVKEPEATKQDDQGPPTIDPAAQAWIDRNEWFTKPENAHLGREAELIEKSLREKGYAIGPELYKKLDEELANLPDFDDVLVVATPRQERQQPRRTASRSSNGGEPPANRANGKGLTKYDIQTMKQYGLDPNDPIERKTYLKYKRPAA